MFLFIYFYPYISYISSFLLGHQCSDRKLYSLAPETSLSTWIVKEAAAGSSTSQNSSPLVGTTRAAGKAGPSLPSSTSCKKMVIVLQYSSNITKLSAISISADPL